MDASELEPGERRAERRRVAAAVFGGLGAAALLVAAAVFQPLTPSEARLLLDGSGAEGAGPWLSRVWTSWAGSMPLTARSLSVLLALFALALVARTAARALVRPLPVLIAILGMAAAPAFWLQGSAVGGAAWPGLAGALLALALAGSGPGRERLRRGSRWALVLLAAAPWALPASWAGPRYEPEGELGAPFLAGLYLPEELGHRAGALLDVALCLAALLAARGGRPADLVALLLMGISWLAAQATGLAPVVALLALAPVAPTAFLLAAAADQPARGRPLPAAAILLVATLAAAAPLARALSDTEAAADPRQTLEWLTWNEDQRSWVLFFGPRRDLYRFYERTGHRTGHETLPVPDLTILSEVVDRALVLGVPRVAVVEPDAEARALLDERLRADRSFPPPPETPTVGVWRR